MRRPQALPLPDVLEFMQVLWAVVHGLEQISKRMTLSHGVTGPQRLVLRLIGLHPGLSLGQLATTLHLHPSTLTGVLRRLLKQRLVLRRRDPADGRRAVLRLTPRGRRVNRNRQGTAEIAVEQALRRVPRRDRACAQRTLAAIAGAFTS